MVSYPSLNAKPYTRRVKLNPETKIEPIKLNIEKRFDFDDFSDLENEMVSLVNTFASSVEEYAKEQTRQYDLFVLSELHKRGYDLLRLENSDCHRYTQSISANCERTQFYVDGVLVLTVKQTTRFENTDGKYMFYTDFEVED